MSSPVTNCPPCKAYVEAHPWELDPDYPDTMARWHHHDSPFASPIRCAFDGDGNFDLGNWNCMSMAPLRSAALTAEVWNDDDFLAVVPWGYDFIVLSYYKHHGATTGAWFCDGRVMRALRLADIESPTT